MTLPISNSLSDLEKSYESAKLKLNGVSQSLKKLEKQCLLKNKKECLQRYDAVLHGHHNMSKSREKVSLNCIKDCFTKIEHHDLLVNYDDISDPIDRRTLIDCKNTCLEDVISKIHKETKMLQKTESDLKFIYLGNFK